VEKRKRGENVKETGGKGKKIENRVKMQNRKELLQKCVIGSRKDVCLDWEKYRFWKGGGRRGETTYRPLQRMQNNPE
jgi:hypothetical protein